MQNEPEPQKPEVDADGRSGRSPGTERSPMHPTIQFQEIQIGQFFEFRGRRYQKVALSMASDEDRNGTIFQAQTGVLPDPLSRTAQPNDP